MSGVDAGEFSSLIRESRAKLGKSRAEIAQRVGIHVAFYGCIECGTKNPSLRTFARLHYHLKFDANAALDSLNVEVGKPRDIKRRAQRLRRVVNPGQYAVFGRLLAEARRDARLTQASLSRAINLSARYIIRIECGHNLPSVPRLAQWRRVLEFDANYLLDRLNGIDEPTPFHNFGSIIKQARVERGLTPNEAARLAGCIVSRYRRIELGREIPSIGLLVQIHRVLRFDASVALQRLWYRRADVIDRATDVADSV